MPLVLVSITIPAQKRQKWDVKSRMGYLAGYEPYSSGYLIWFPSMKQLGKAHDMIFHEELIMLAMPVLYGNEEVGVLVPAVVEVKPTTPENTRLTIHISPHPKPTLSNAHEASRLVVNVPDYPYGTMRSRRVCNNLQINMMMMMMDEDIEGDLGVFSATLKDPNITEALNMQGDEGFAWEVAQQSEWENMVKFDVFRPPAEPPPGMKVSKTGTVC
jgi:hypothetical protein